MMRLTLSVCYFFVTYLQLVLGNNCDDLGILLYEDIGCKPVKLKGKECPIRYECQDFSNQSNRCLLRGRSYNAHEHVNDSITYPSCAIGCFCNEDRSFTCAVLDCPEWLGNRVGEGCHRKYEADKCCSVGQICPTPGCDIPSCNVDGVTYLEGQRFSPKNVCSRCVCPKDFNGKLEEPYCQRMSCNIQIYQADKLEQNCAPFYLKGNEPLCCPYTWVCPSDNDEIIKINEDVKENPDLTCKFGSKTVKLGEGLEKEVDIYGTLMKSRCECVLPPYLTCKN